MGDLRTAVRRLRQAPLFAMFAIASLALGLGGTTAAYSIVQAVLWPQLGIDAPDRIVFVARPQMGGVTWMGHISDADFNELRRQQRSLESVAGTLMASRIVTGGSVAASVTTEGVTGNYFQTLGVRASIGRTIVETDEEPSATRVMVLSHQFWRSTFASDPAVIGRTVRVDGEPIAIVGVAPRDFNGVLTIDPREARFRTQIWISSRPENRPLVNARAGARRSWTAFGRVRSGQSIDSVGAELSVIAGRLDASRPAATAGAPVTPFRWMTRTIPEIRAPRTNRSMPAGAGIVALVGLILIVGCTNLANLTLARGAARMPELVVRRALGASRVRLVRELIAENLLLAIAGGIAALVAAAWLIHAAADAISISGKTLAELFDPRLNVFVYGFAGGGVTLALMVFGLVPALRLTRVERADSIGRDATAASPRWRGQRHLILAQVTVSTMLFLMASYFVAAVSRTSNLSTGLDLDRLVMAQVVFPSSPGGADRTQAWIADLLRDPAGDAHIDRVSMATSLPSWVSTSANVVPADRPELLDRLESHVGISLAAPDLLQTLGVAVTSGRTFDGRDRVGSQRVAIVNASLARRLFGGTTALGRQVLARRIPQTTEYVLDTLTIVGVAADTDVEAHGRPDEIVYVPYAQHVFDVAPSVLVARLRPNTDVATGVTALRNRIRQSAPDVAIVAVSPAEPMLAPDRPNIRAVSVVALGLGAFALALTMVGLFGVLSHVVTRRSREVGVRIALGAEPRQILSLVIHEGLRPVIAGVALGVVLGIPARVLANDALDGFWSVEPLLFVMVSVLLVACGIVACYWPARRASLVDPIVVLKDS